MANRHENITLAVSTVVLGVVVGYGSVLLSLFFNFIQHTFLGFNETYVHPVAWAAPSWRRLVSLIIGGLIAGFVWWLVHTKMKKPVSINAAVAGSKMPVSTTIVHTFTQIFYVATGGSVGRELAPRELGSMISQTWQRLLKRFGATLAEDDRQLLIAAAAGAGFAGVYIAPLTGAMFCVEILLKKVTGRTIAVSFSMASIAMLVGASVKSFHPYYAVNTSAFSPRTVLLVLIIGPLCGLLGGLFRKAFKWAGAKAPKDGRLLWQMPLVALLTGLIAMVFPEIMGNGRALAQTVFANTDVSFIKIFLVGAAAKALVTVLTLRAGAAGGTIAPSISIGATIGALVGFIANLFFPGLPVWQYSLIGAGALLAASQQAPLMALFMILEIDHLDYSALLPLAVAVALAIATSHLIIKPAPSRQA